MASETRLKVRPTKAPLIFRQGAAKDVTAEAFVEHRLHGVTLSKSAWSTIRRMLNGETVTQEASGLGKREWSELQALLKE